jgi:hypothetical protein
LRLLCSNRLASQPGHHADHDEQRRCPTHSSPFLISRTRDGKAEPCGRISTLAKGKKAKLRKAARSRPKKQYFEPMATDVKESKTNDLCENVNRDQCGQSPKKTITSRFQQELRSQQKNTPE